MKKKFHFEKKKKKKFQAENYAVILCFRPIPVETKT